MLYQYATCNASRQKEGVLSLFTPMRSNHAAQFDNSFSFIVHIRYPDKGFCTEIADLDIFLQRDLIKIFNWSKVQPKAYIGILISLLINVIQSIRVPSLRRYYAHELHYFVLKLRYLGFYQCISFTL